MNLLEFSISTEKMLNKLTGSAFAECFIHSKITCFRQYHNGLITSNSHGIDFFKNVIKHWEDPLSWCNDEKSIYEYNFTKLLIQNKK